MRRSGIVVFLAGSAISAVVIAGCSSGSSTGSSSPAPASAQPANPSAGGSGSGSGSGSGTAIGTTSTSLGTFLVDGQGKTLYLFEKDKNGQSACNDAACVGVWPPLLTTGAPTAGSGVTAGNLGTVKRADGKTQVTYGGHPLYYFTSDTNAGDTKGQNLDSFGADWYVVGPDGKKVDKD